MSTITIKNTSILHGQTSCILRHCHETQVAKLSEELKTYFAGTLPRGTCIVCLYTGNYGIPFINIIPYGYAKLMRLEKSIGFCFDIEVKTHTDISELPLFNQEVGCGVEN